MAGPKDIFIVCTSADDGTFVTRLSQQLAAAGLTFAVAAAHVPTDSPDHSTRELEIQQSDNILWMVSAASVVSERCLQQLTLAVQNHKTDFCPFYPRQKRRLCQSWGSRPGVPPPSGPRCCKKPSAADIPPYPQSFGNEPGLSFAADDEEFQAGLDQLLGWLQHDKDYIRLHTQLLLAALRWQQQQDPQYLLLGEDLEEAEQWLKQHQQRDDLRATDLHCEYIAESIKKHSKFDGSGVF